ncbi:MAG: 2-C-methyl-D-erythritol 2,4-cyclodiphosphate synthase [Candidatus Omnitrophica bacterium]|nr:2-C-methyl-D-erythritol 2,4-cyclodiphosphate synthase [Candidatus Omnitrophota bacterium]MBU2044287.1 2-C-methyl-D-erythritol 2,4-cyclodiphosphate synthase [Candidatus Omnitrophota bacterium]MBU2250753.1 2-C-methyl-D-erythritol 2,4-cyclodiphosphate synthase [Candidatus Omnitrophota bacterium]
MKDHSIGLGFDVHKFSRKKKSLILGGAKIPSSLSLDAVSDGDLVLHAICDAICGAANLGDIGDYFSPQSKASQNIDSKQITRFILKKISGRYRIKNIDIIIISQRPRLVSHKKAITDSLKKILAVSNLNVKIKSKEGLDILGTKDSMSCLAIALLRKK